MSLPNARFGMVSFVLSAIGLSATGLSATGLSAISLCVIGACLNLPATAQEIDPNPSFRNTRDPNQVPTARYARGEEVDLALIIEEWRDRFPQTPVYACACLEETCDSSAIWPFRRFTRYQPFVALGPTNAATSERQGFNCFDIETGEDPKAN